jgi:hypothetical protein
MNTALLSIALLAPVAAMPPTVGTISEDVAFAEATNFSGGGFQNLTDRQLSEQPANVQVLVYLTPW